MKRSYFSTRNDLLVFEILSQRNAASHHSGEFGIVHDVGAGVGRQVLFQGLFRNPADASSQAGQSCSVHDSFHELVVGHGYISEIFFQFTENNRFLRLHFGFFLQFSHKNLPFSSSLPSSRKRSSHSSHTAIEMTFKV